MELNPHHPTTKAMHDHWHKIVVVLMLKFKIRDIILTREDMEKCNGENITIQDAGKKLHLAIVNDEEANRLVRQHGGVSLS